MRLPTFLIIGAPKCGTTALHAYLAEHPEVAMTSDKEPMLFTGPDWEQRIAGYEALFDRDAPVRGESSTAYTSFPFEPEVPARVHARLPAARFVYIVRDPVPRVLSHYAQNVWDRHRVRPFAELMDDLEHPLNMPVWCSRYATQLERWTAFFPLEQMLVLDQRDLLRDRDETVRRVLAFLDVDPEFTSPAWEAEHNVATRHRRPTRLGARLPRLRNGPLERVLTRAVPKPALDDAQRERLVALLRPEAERLHALTGLPIGHWSL